MQATYCYIPDEAKFKAFLSTDALEFSARIQLKQMQIAKICMDAAGTSWEIHFTTRAYVEDKTLQAVAAKLTAAFSLVSCVFVNDKNAKVTTTSAKIEPPAEEQDAKKLFANNTISIMAEEEEIPLPPEPSMVDEAPEVEITECTGQPLAEDIPLPEMPDIEIGATEPKEEPCTMDYSNNNYDPEYEAAFNNLYGKKDTNIILGKKIKENVRIRPLDTLIEEEARVVIEGMFVKSMDKDGNMQTFIEKELRTGAIIVTFNLVDATNGIYIRMRFDKRNYEDPRKACNEFKNKFKPGMYLRIQGNVEPDRFNFDEMTMDPVSIMKVDAPPERTDKAEVKRVELHCHTKMSKMDAVTPMQELVRKAIKFGHKALAITDHGVVQAFPFCYDEVEDQHSDLKLIFGMEGYLMSDRKLKDSGLDQEAGDPTKTSGKKQKIKSNHIIILAKNETGLRNLYKLVSISNLNYLYRRPLLPREVIQEHREGLILGSACEAGELYRAILAGASDEELEEIASFYDYLEIQPTGNNMFLVREKVCSIEDLQNHNRKIYEIGKKLGKLTVATCDVHFLNPEDAKLRAILQAGQHYKDADEQPPLYFRTTEEMLAEFAYLGKDIAYEVCVTNTNKISDMVERFKPVPDRDQLYSPFIPGVEKKVKDMSYDHAHEWYGENLPKVVEERLEMELNSIIGNGFSVLYYIAHRLVKKSLEIGYLVGSRGSVGSSFVATMLDITEVNALPPHYRCPECKHSEFFLKNEVDSGFDLPVKNCPHCGAEMVRDGHNIPFAVFLGFKGDKVPDIDLNFSEEAQHNAHEFTKELFGRDNVCRAGTIATIAIKTAKSFIEKYYEERNRKVHPAYVASMVADFAGVKRTTGQHPGGIMVVPRNMDIHYITPMNWPADEKTDKTIDITTHYDYHSINDRLVKLDILGHDDPNVIKKLEEYLSTPDKPFSAKYDIPMGDEETLRIFQNTSSLGVTPEQIDSEVGTFGIPECGTAFVRQMIQDVQPKNFSQIVRVSGYSHGTDVWLNNAQDLIKEGKPVSGTISTRDDIMTYLISVGVEPSLAFKTMEHVRKGKAAKKGLEPAMLEAMKAANVPEWYIHSCEKVQYLFPKAHAVAYVLMAYRIAWCKVHRPLAFYAAYFTVRAPEFDFAIVGKGPEYVKQYIKNVRAAGFKATAAEKTNVTYLELVNEMFERGFHFDNIDLYESDAERFRITENGLRPPIAALSGVGNVAAKAIAEVVDKNNPFISQEDLRQRAGIGKAVTERLGEIGALGDLPDSNQMDLFADFM